jgi:hypothetical protein
MTHETRKTYFVVEAFETFPSPSKPPSLEACGERNYNFRQGIMRTCQHGLTQTYNRFHNPIEISIEIAELRRLHVKMDQAVAAAYGWDDLNLDHGFRPTKQGIRYTISEAACFKVLDRLLALNHKRHAEEAELGAQGSRITAKRGRAQKDTREQILIEL